MLYMSATYLFSIHIHIMYNDIMTQELLVQILFKIYQHLKKNVIY